MERVATLSTTSHEAQDHARAFRFTPISRPSFKLIVSTE